MDIKIFKLEEAQRRTLFAENLRDMLRNGPISAQKLADKIGVSITTIYTYSRGKTFPSEERIQQIAAGLGVTVDDLFDDTYAPWKFGTGEE